APALRAPSRQLEQAIRSGSRTVGGSPRLHGVFVVSEVALSVILLVGAGTLGRALLRLSNMDPGLDIHHVLTSRFALSPAVLTDPARTRATWQEMLSRARRVPGVESIAMVDTIPMRRGNNPLGYWLTRPAPQANQMPMALATCVSPDYLKVMHIPLRRGRFF